MQIKAVIAKTEADDFALSAFLAEDFFGDFLGAFHAYFLVRLIPRVKQMLEIFLANDLTGVKRAD